MFGCLCLLPLSVARISLRRRVRGYVVKVVNGEVLRVYAALQVRHKGRLNVADRVPVYSSEEGMVLDFVRRIAAQAVLGFPDHAVQSDQASGASGGAQESRKRPIVSQ